MKSKKKLNKYISFQREFIDLSGEKLPEKVKFRIADEDSFFYYIKNGDIEIKVNKALENELFVTGEIFNNNKN